MLDLRPRTLRILLFSLGLFATGAVVLWFGLVNQDRFRLSWAETTRRKFLLYNGPVIELYGDKSLEQTFVSNYPGLAQIDILFTGSSVEQQDVVFHLKQRCDAGDDMVTISREISPSDDLLFDSFSFPPIDNSAGQPYCIVLEAPTTPPSKAVRLQLSTGDLYPYGELTVRDPTAHAQNRTEVETPDSVIRPADFAFRVFLPIILGKNRTIIEPNEDIGFRLRYSGRLAPTLRVFVARLTANKPYIWGSAWFYAGLVLAYMVLLAALFYLALRAVPSEHD